MSIFSCQISITSHWAITTFKVSRGRMPGTPGSTERIGWGDLETEPGYLIVELGERGTGAAVERVSVPTARPMLSHTVPAAVLASQDGVKIADHVLTWLQGLESPEAMTRVVLPDVARPVRRNVEALVREDAGALVWSVQVTGRPAESSAMADRNPDLPALSLLDQFAAFTAAEEANGNFDPVFARQFAEIGEAGARTGPGSAGAATDERGSLMNLVEVEIEDYRQFHGLTTFSPAQQAMIGIIGENGAGKTTLFEAIEWCLYNPSWIRNEDIRPRTLGGKPRVKVTLEHPLTGEQFEVERELKGRTVSASVYRVSNPDTPVVQGTKQVTEYVTKSLLGLTYQAFVATFFTRQKELHFFGNLRAAERRREVGRLLGLETIRIAQQSIGTQRQEKLSASRQLSRIYEDQSAGRDFAAERIAARALVDHRLDRTSTERRILAASQYIACSGTGDALGRGASRRTISGSTSRSLQASG